MSDIGTPLELLSQIRDDAERVIAQENLVVQAAGTKNIAFLINGIGFFCDAAVVKEVTSCSGLVSVPLTKNWLRGVVNTKGVMYSVSDMSLLAGFERAISAERGHLLILGDHDRQNALLVNRVVGFRYYNEPEKITNKEAKVDEIESLAAFVDDVYLQNDQYWYKLDVEKMVLSAQFNEVQ